MPEREIGQQLRVVQAELELAGLDPAGDLGQALVDGRGAAQPLLFGDDEAVDLLALGAAALIQSWSSATRVLSSDQPARTASSSGAA